MVDFADDILNQFYVWGLLYIPIFVGNCYSPINDMLALIPIMEPNRQQANICHSASMS